MNKTANYEWMSHYQSTFRTETCWFLQKPPQAALSSLCTNARMNVLMLKWDASTVVLMERKGGATCGADESEGDGASSYVNSHIRYCVIDNKSEIIVHPWVPGRLQEGHLEIAWTRCQRWNRGSAGTNPESDHRDITRVVLVDSIIRPMASGSSLVVTSTAWPPEAWARSLYSWASDSAILLCRCWFASRRLLRLSTVEPEIKKFTCTDKKWTTVGQN